MWLWRHNQAIHIGSFICEKSLTGKFYTPFYWHDDVYICYCVASQIKRGKIILSLDRYQDCTRYKRLFNSLLIPFNQIQKRYFETSKSHLSGLLIEFFEEISAIPQRISFFFRLTGQIVIFCVNLKDTCALNNVFLFWFHALRSLMFIVILKEVISA